MATIRRFEEMEAWQTARELTRLVYGLSNDGTFASDWGLRDQMRRSAVSIMSNIAEGFESRTQAQFVDYLGRAKASAGELRAQAYVALDVNHINEAQFQQLMALVQSCSRQLAGLIAYLESQPNARRIRETYAEYTLA